MLPAWPNAGVGNAGGSNSMLGPPSLPLPPSTEGTMPPSGSIVTRGPSAVVPEPPPHATIATTAILMHHAARRIIGRAPDVTIPCFRGSLHGLSLATAGPQH